MQLSTEAILWDERSQVVAIADRNYGDSRVEVQQPKHGQFMENGGEMPSILAPDVLETVGALTVKAGRALGIKRGTCKGDLVWTRKGPSVIEIAARLSSAEFCGNLALYATGVNYVQEAIKIALGTEPDWTALEPKYRRHAAVRCFFARPGQVESIEGLEEVQKHDWLAGLDLYTEVNGYVRPLTGHQDRIGKFFVVAETRMELYERIDCVYETVKIKTRDVPLPIFWMA